MGIRKKISLVIYRFKERGLEVFLVNNSDQAKEDWAIPSGEIEHERSEVLAQEDHCIELDPVMVENGNAEEALAIEGEWHDIPSLKSMLIEDAVKVKETIKSMNSGSFFAFREGIKKLLPKYQYEFLKELRDVLIDRNSTKDL